MKQKLMRRGRIAKSKKSRRTQRAEAQRTFRLVMKKKGFRPIQAYLPESIVEVLDKEARKENRSRGEELELILKPIYKDKMRTEK